MEGLIVGVSCVLGIVNVVCWIIVLVKLFQAEGVGMGIFGFICGIYTFIWGWQHAEEEGIKGVMLVWTILILVDLAAKFGVPLMTGAAG